MLSQNYFLPNLWKFNNQQDRAMYLANSPTRFKRLKTCFDDLAEENEEIFSTVNVTRCKFMGEEEVLLARNEAAISDWAIDI